MKLLFPSGVRLRSSPRAGWSRRSPAGILAFLLGKGWGSPEPPLGPTGRAPCFEGCCVLALCVPVCTPVRPSPPQDKTILRNKSKKKKVMAKACSFQKKTQHKQRHPTMAFAFS